MKPASSLRSFFSNACCLRRNLIGLVMAAGLTLFLSQTARAASTLPFYEPFYYSEGEALGTNGTPPPTTSGTVWDQGNSATGSSARIRTNAALSYVSLVTSNTSSGLAASTGTGKNRGLDFTSQSSGTVYVSFLLQLSNYPAVSPRAFAGLASGTGTGPTPSATVLVDPLGRLGVAKNAWGPASSGLTYALSSNVTYLVVMRYKFNTSSASDDEVALWLNPTSLGNNANVPPPTVTTISGADVNSLQTFYYLASSSTANFNVIFPFSIDEIRIGTSWADVTPVTCSAGAIFAVTGGGSACSGSGFSVGLSGSESGVDYWLVTNGVFSGEVASGTGSALSFGTQTASGIYTVFGSNTASSCVSWMSGSAVVNNLQPPNIATQPTSVTVANGGTATISVSATGDGLTYQWRRNGANLADGTKYSGSSSANLTISSCNNADQATTSDGYDVVITGSCSPAATSTRVALTLDTAADLFWVGGNPGNLWDVATSANFSGGTGVFNYGDNVTFNDSTVVNNLNLVSSFLSPGTVTVDTATTYTFGGTGSLIGPGTIYMIGPGTLVLSTVNTFNGGIVISNGIVSFNNAVELGTGPITLAGGSLSSANVQGITCNNPLNVVSDSSVIINNTSTSALILTNSIGGPNGTLTFTNAAVGRGPVFRLTGAGFTNNRPIVLNLGPLTDGSGTNYSTNLFMNFANTSGDQVFNGTISGGGTIQRSANGGTTLLNAVNTYTNETQVSGGTLLVNGQIDVAPVTVTGGTLGGAGTILGPVTVTNATLAPGNRGIGTLNINNALTLRNNSTNSFEISKTPQTNDLVRGVTTLTYGGILSVTNLAGTLVVGDTFTLFNASSSSGNFSAVTGSAGPGLGFSFNPANGVLTVVTGVATNPTNISYSVTSSNVTLSWPVDHVGWTLQSQTNSPGGGLGTNWFTVPGSTATNSVVVPLDRTKGSAFYRLHLVVP
jgi:autotransporter-associated beta strand protein